MDSMRPGWSRSQPCSICLMATRCRCRLRAAERARNQRELHAARIARDVALGDVGERADHDVATVLRTQLRRHRLEASAVEQVQEQGFDDVVAVVSERDLGDAVLRGEAVERPAAQPRAQAAHRAPLGHHALDHAVGVLLDDPERHARGAVRYSGSTCAGKPGCFWSRLTASSSKRHRRTALQGQQHVEQRVGILAAGQADHHAIALLDHPVVRDRLAGQGAQARAQAAQRRGGRAHAGCSRYLCSR